MLSSPCVLGERFQCHNYFGHFDNKFYKIKTGRELAPEYPIPFVDEPFIPPIYQYTFNIQVKLTGSGDALHKTAQKSVAQIRRNTSLKVIMSVSRTRVQTTGKHEVLYYSNKSVKPVPL